MYTYKELSLETWSDFEKLAQKHKGVWGGCWCTWFHYSKSIKKGTAEENKQLKYDLVKQNKTHAVLVYEQGLAVAWCQYGPADELPNIGHKKQVEDTNYVMPDWRITCLFVDRDHRRKGLSKLAIKAAIESIESQGGGSIEAYPHKMTGKKVSSSFLCYGTDKLFTDLGFEVIKKKGKNHLVMRLGENNEIR